jgi:pimeloyl-ACP methyl ester carboxylesterase
MAVAVAEETRSLQLSGVALEVTERGRGRALLFLHPGHPSGRLDPRAPVLDRLAQSFRVVAPTHPGFGRTDAPAWMNSIDDLAYLYLDLLDALDVEDAVLVGASLGGWIAAEMAVKSTARIARLILANPVGIKVGSRETRDIADIYSLLDKDIAQLAYADPRLGTPDRANLSDDDYLFMARSREATARYGWSPYLHDPKLKGRLHRIRIPTLVLWGTADRIASEDYGRAYAAAIPGARFTPIEGAGHFPHREQPERFAQAVLAFAEAKDKAP